MTIVLEKVGEREVFCSYSPTESAMLGMRIALQGEGLSFTLQVLKKANFAKFGLLCQGNRAREVGLFTSDGIHITEVDRSLEETLDYWRDYLLTALLEVAPPMENFLALLPEGEIEDIKLSEEGLSEEGGVLMSARVKLPSLLSSRIETKLYLMVLTEDKERRVHCQVRSNMKGEDQMIKWVGEGDTILLHQEGGYVSNKREVLAVRDAALLNIETLLESEKRALTNYRQRIQA